MRIINIVTVKNGVVNDINSFPIHEEQLSNEIINEAEKCFKDNVVKLIGSAETMENEEITFDNVLENGYYSIGNESINICWSYT